MADQSNFKSVLVIKICRSDDNAMKPFRTLDAAGRSMATNGNTFANAVGTLLTQFPDSPLIFRRVVSELTTALSKA